jgi:hypothetical protein
VLPKCGKAADACYVGLAQLFYFKNNKIIPKYQNAPILIENYTKNSVKEQNYLHMQSLFFVFYKAKDVF